MPAPRARPVPSGHTGTVPSLVLSPGGRTSATGWAGAFAVKPVRHRRRLRQRTRHDAPGNRSLLLRAPDGALVHPFVPVTPAAVAKVAR
ncbi:hypothetical protein [Streptomyces sp. enrichment culture]|uniref:hypothetical protein n=1 Tax=Streptomyces sp. enrichment culture TaxID=1795815 RepID=UPI003F57B71D